MKKEGFKTDCTPYELFKMWYFYSCIPISLQPDGLKLKFRFRVGLSVTCFKYDTFNIVFMKKCGVEQLINFLVY